MQIGRNVRYDIKVWRKEEDYQSDFSCLPAALNLRSHRADWLLLFRSQERDCLRRILGGKIIDIRYYGGGRNGESQVCATHRFRVSGVPDVRCSTAIFLAS